MWKLVNPAPALGAALVINSLILITAGAAFHASGRTDVASIETAHELLAPLLGSSAAPLLFAIALLAAGQNSTLTGVMAGQVVMEGFLSWRVHPVTRRLITRGLAIAPVLAVVLLVGDGGVSAALVFSQVILSFQLPFTLVPLMLLTSDARRVGRDLVNGWAAHVVGWALVAFIVALNVYMLVSIIGSGELLG